MSGSFITVFFQTIYDRITNYFLTYPRYIKKVRFDAKDIPDTNVFTDLDKWYTKYYLTDYTHRRNHTKMQIWCIFQKINDLQNGIDFNENDPEYIMITNIYAKINETSPDIINEIHAE
jgi:hypothetical protein